MIRYAIVGCGGVGAKRAAALAPGSLVDCVDVNTERAQALAFTHGATAHSSLKPGCYDAVIVATTNCHLAPVASRALAMGKHVLIEKPGAISAVELAGLRDSGKVVRVGYNHAYHPGIMAAKAIVSDISFGEVLMMRARYGHGGRLGYESEWRANRELSGGGELIDQGVHLLHLARMFMGPLPLEAGHLSTLFWKMPVEDNAFVSLRDRRGRTAWLHASCMEWKNVFSLELYGSMDKVVVEGLGGSYGQEKCIHYAMSSGMGVPAKTEWNYPGPDMSWRLELDDFEREIESGETLNRGLEDAISCLEIVDRFYARPPLTGI